MGAINASFIIILYFIVDLLVGPSRNRGLFTQYMDRRGCHSYRAYSRINIEYTLNYIIKFGCVSGIRTLLLGHIALQAALHLGGIVLNLDGGLKEVIAQMNRRCGRIQDPLRIRIFSCSVERRAVRAND